MARMGLNNVGVGIKVEVTRAGWVVSDLVRKGPAALNGKIHVGDLIVSVNGTRIQGASSALAPMMIGLPGTEVEIGVRRKPGGEVMRVTLIRGGPAAEPGNSAASRSKSSLGGGANSSFAQGSSSHNASSPSWQNSLDSTTDNDSSSIVNLSPSGRRSAASKPTFTPSVTIRPGTASSVDHGVEPSFAYDLGLEYSIDDAMLGDHDQLPRRARSVALLPGMGTKGRYEVPDLTHRWILDTNAPSIPASRPQSGRPKSAATMSSSSRREQVCFTSTLSTSATCSLTFTHSKCSAIPLIVRHKLSLSLAITSKPMLYPPISPKTPETRTLDPRPRILSRSL